MKKTIRQLFAGVVSLAMVLAVGVNTGQNNSVSNIPLNISAADNNNDDWLHVCGNEIHDANCNPVWLAGVNWFGFNCNEVMFHGLDAGKDFRKIASEIADHGFNIIRLPIATELIYSWKTGKPIKGSTNFANDVPYYVNNPWFLTADGQQMNSMEIFDTCMAIFKEYGLKVLIDIHSAEIDNSGHDKNLWYHGRFNDPKDWQDCLVWLADKYKNDDTILAYDLKNEPHGKPQEATAGTGAKWDNSNDKNNWRKAAEDCGNAILKVNPNALILVEGIEVYPKFENGANWNSPPGGYGAPENYYGGWWGGNLRGVKDLPITMKSPTSGKSQLVYSPHEYGPSVYAQAWFNKDFTLQTLHDDYMHDTWDYLLPDYPLLIGEWGGHMDGKENQKWMTIMRDYMIANRVHHTFWCLNPNSGDTGGLLDHSWDKWDSAKYNLVEPSLWKDSNGYIGLDHEIPLGKNGQTLSQYYNGSPKPPIQTAPSGTTTTPTTLTTTNPTTTAEIVTSETTLNTTTKITDETNNVTIEATLYGDVNVDGKVDIADLVLLAKAVTGKLNLAGVSLANADCQKGNGINFADLAALIKYLTNRELVLPFT